MDEVVLAFNLDGAGCRGEFKTAFSLYGCDDDTEAAIREAFGDEEQFVEGPACPRATT